MQINVCISCDDNYARYAGVVIASVLANAAPSDELTFYILDGGVSAESKAKILSLTPKINFVAVDEAIFDDYKNIQTHAYISLPAYFRLKMAELLPDVEKVIYFDCDVVVNTSLAELFAQDTGECALAGVLDLNKHELKRNPWYVNSGMLLFDLKKVREQGIENELLEYTKKNFDKITKGDQEIINAALKGRIKLLHENWNVQVSNFTNRSSYTQNPWIIHYVSTQKPWKFGSWNYFKGYYFKYLALTPWKNEKQGVLSEVASWFGYLAYRPLFLLRPRFYEAFYETYVRKVPRFDANTFFVWEPCSKSHAEVVPGFAKYLLDLGYNVSVLVTPKHIRDGLFSRFNDKRIYLNNLSQKQIRKFFEQDDLSGVKGVLVTTATKLTGGETDYERARNFFKDPTKIFLVEHEIQRAVSTENIITLREMDYEGKKTVVVNPHYFGEVKVTPKNEITNFITIGAIRAGKKNTNIIINAVKTLHERGVQNFKVTVVGKGSLRSLPCELRKYFDIKGHLGFAQMYAELEKADFLLTAYEPDNPAHVRYVTSGTSGAFQLVYGFVKPCVITRSFAPINGFDEGNAILYDDDYADALQRAINLSDYAAMQDNLKKYADWLYTESRENLRRLIGG